MTSQVSVIYCSATGSVHDLANAVAAGAAAAELKQFMDQTGGLWQHGVMAGRPATSFISSQNLHAGRESSMLA